VDQKLRGIEAFVCKYLYIDTIHWLSTQTVFIWTYNSWAYNDNSYFIEVSINRVSTIFGLTLSWHTVLHGYLVPKWLYWPSLWIKRKLILWFRPHGNERQPCVNDFWSCESDNEKKTWSLWHIIIVLAVFTAKNASDDITTLWQKWASPLRQRFLFLHH
jgi:hypothetical protein